MENDLFYPIHQLLTDASGHGLIVGKNGSLTYVVKLSSPETYSLYKDAIEDRHTVFMQAFSHMPDNSYIHKQDVYRLTAFNPSSLATSYLSKADQEHFVGREYLTHTCMLAFTLAGLGSLSEKYLKKIIKFDENLSKEDKDKLSEFLAAVEFALNNLSSLRNTAISHLTEDELKSYIFESANFYDSRGIRDINFAEEITAGQIKSKVYAITDAEFFSKADYAVADKDYTVSREKSELYMSPAEAFAGIHLNCNHTYNQIFYFYGDKKLKEELKANYEDHDKNQSWDKTTLIPKTEALGSLLKEINKNKEVLCYAHYSILLWDEDAVRLDSFEKTLRSALDLYNIHYYIPSFGNLADIYGSGIIGCVASLERQYMFLTTLALASLFMVHYTTFQNDPDGVWFNDRLFQIPLKKDIWDAKKKRIHARNAIVIAPTGSGKSFTVNSIVQQLLDQNYTVVAVEFGNSFKQLCYLYPEISVHVEYDQNEPLGINPFDIGVEGLSPEKRDTLVALCMRFWKLPQADANQTVALRKFIVLYYRDNKSDWSFQNFYEYLNRNFHRLCEEEGISEDFFDIKSFLHICSEFMPGGGYANLCASEGIGGTLSGKRFIHFELTKVKNDPFVASIVMSLLFDVINNKILSDTSQKGYIIFDEYAETAQMKPINSLDVDIHQAVATFYQKIRKENGAVMTIIQSPVQLPNNEYTKGIVANTQLLYVLEGTEVVYDAIIETFKIRDNAQINQMKSIKNRYSGDRPYSECWIRFGQDYSLTVRIEASKRKFLAFQTEGETRAALDKLYASNGHNMEKAIEHFLKQ